jgi:hypothetical protein
VVQAAPFLLWAIHQQINYAVTNPADFRLGSFRGLGFERQSGVDPTLFPFRVVAYFGVPHGHQFTGGLI